MTTTTHNTQYLKLTQTAGLVLAGGQSTRMGKQNKALSQLKGQTLLQHSLSTMAKNLSPLSPLIISAGPHNYPQAPHILQLPDDGTCGPLAGIAVGLEWLSTQTTQQPKLKWLAVSPCDTPFMPSDWVAQLHARRPNNALACYVHAERDHFAHSLWHLSTLAHVQHALKQEQLALGQVLKKLHATPVVLRLEHNCEHFGNINTPADVLAAQSSKSQFSNKN